MPVASQNVSATLRPSDRPYREIGSIEGYLQGVERDGRGRRIAAIRARVTGELVKCIVAETAMPALEDCQIGDVWRNKRVQVYGILHFRVLGKLDYIEAHNFIFFRDRHELPQLDDIVDPSFTGGLHSEDYLDRMRNGDLS